MVYCDARALAFYYYAFYDLNYFQRNLGMFMMTSAVGLFAARGIRHLYLGSCYSRNALYKTQFVSTERMSKAKIDRDALKLVPKGMRSLWH